MGNQSGSRLGGDDYQHLYSWYQMLQLLDEDSEYAYATLEHPTAGAADDLTLHTKQGTGRPVRFVQVKWHIDLDGQYSFEALAAADPGKKSLLRKLLESWKALREVGALEVWLVSNWSLAPGPDLGRYVADRGRALTDAFFPKKNPSPAAKARRRWAQETGAGDEEAVAFFRDLRFDVGYGSIDRLGGYAGPPNAKFSSSAAGLQDLGSTRILHGRSDRGMKNTA